MLNLDLYLARIAYQGSLAPNLATLTALHRTHLQAIIYENLDIHFGRPLTLDLGQMFDKLVNQRRGGWCYEMNGLFAWVLQELGFQVTLLSGAVNRLAQGAADHLVLLVALDRPYLVDVGFGPGFLEPLPLIAGEHQQGFLRFRLGREANLWRFYNDTCGGMGYDFTLCPCTLDNFAHKCHWLQTSPESNFTRLAVCHRLTGRSVISLRGAVLKTYTADGVTEQVIDNLQTYAQVLHDLFDLELEQTNELWTKVWARHWVWVAENKQIMA